MLVRLGGTREAMEKANLVGRYPLVSKTVVIILSLDLKLERLKDVHEVEAIIVSSCAMYSGHFPNKN
jgi:hypothetical protein